MGPLAGTKVIEFAGIGPGPFCAMLLSDMGAEVLRIDRLEPADLGTPTEQRFNVLTRGRRSVAVDLKSPDGVAAAPCLVRRADTLIERFRPGVMERLGLGPDNCFAFNRKLVYGRVTGWGQDGPLAKEAGRDINYIALSGALLCIGRAGERPVPPLNLVGDFGGGAAYMMMSIFGLYAAGIWSARRGENVLDGGAPYYDIYDTADGGSICVGSIEPKFYASLLSCLDELNQPRIGSQSFDRHGGFVLCRYGWPAIWGRRRCS